jgi:hypothetical protein
MKLLALRKQDFVESAEEFACYVRTGSNRGIEGVSRYGLY